jgi:hypothetical protein
MISGCFVDVSISEMSGGGWIGGVCVMAVVVTVQALVHVMYCERVMRKVYYVGDLGVIWGSLECLKQVGGSTELPLWCGARGVRTRMQQAEIEIFILR